MYLIRRTLGYLSWHLDCSIGSGVGPNVHIGSPTKLLGKTSGAALKQSRDSHPAFAHPDYLYPPSHLYPNRPLVSTPQDFHTRHLLGLENTNISLCKENINHDPLPSSDSLQAIMPRSQLPNGSSPPHLKTTLPIAPKLNNQTEFFKAFGNGNTNNHPHGLHSVPQAWPPDPSDGNLAITTSPVTSTYSTNNEPSLTSLTTINTRLHRPLSPPDSAGVSPKSHLFDLQDTVTPNLLTNVRPDGGFPSIYGQVTPPNDDGYESLLDTQSQDPYIKEEQPWPAGRKAAANQSNSRQEQKQAPPKRARKYTPRKSKKQTSSESSNPDDARRSKFLERNRVAASKCRQKKKEWTQNLEDRARDLQKDKNNLRVLVESLSEELYYLKTQCMEHRDCECDGIRRYLNDPAHVLASEEVPFDQKASIDVTSDEQGESLGDPSESEKQQASNAKAFANDEQALKALLTSSIEHDSGAEGVSQRLES